MNQVHFSSATDEWSTLPKLLVSFSGGRTSAFMAHELWTKYRDRYQIKFVFANTWQEHEKTLLFVDRCDREWGLDVVWVEAVVHEGRIACTSRVVNFATASRNGEPFEEVIKKYGIPNSSFLHCTRELKLNPIRHYANSIGWGGCLTAVGIRSDEPGRIRSDAEDARIVYPLAHWFPTRKPEIMDWWKDQSFDLGLKDYEGNCRWCHKKSLPKLLRIAKENPEVFAFPASMENLYGMNGQEKNTINRVPRKFFRKHRSANDILGMSKLVQIHTLFEDDDIDSGCAESCDAFA